MPPETRTPAPPAQSLIQAYYEDNVRDVVDNRPAPVREQVAAAMKVIPPTASGLDSWFAEHLKRAPVAQDTALYNVLHGMKEELKKLLAPAASSLRSV